MRKIFFFLITSFPLIAFQLNSGHSLRITAFGHDASYLYSADISGQVKIWTYQGDLVTHIQVAGNIISKLLPHSSKPYVAVLSSKQSKNEILKLVNWHTREKYYQIPLSDLPEHITFSPSGKYLIYSSLNQIVAIKADTGQLIQKFSTPLFGASSFFLSNSEERIMTYSEFPGLIEYRDVGTSSTLKSATTIPYIENLALSKNTRYAIGKKNNMVILLDIISGKKIAQHTFSNIDFFSTDGDLVSVIHHTQEKIFYTSLQRRGLQFIVLKKVSIPEDMHISALHQWKTQIIMGTNEGRIYHLNGTKFNIFSQSLIDSIQNFQYAHNILAYTCNNTSYRLALPLNQSVQGKNRILSVPAHKKENAYQLSISEEGITLHIYNQDTIQYPALGIKDALYVADENILFIGFSTDQNYNTPLIFIRTETTETVPIIIDMFYIIDIAYDKINNILWVMGIDKKRHSILEGRTGLSFEKSWKEALIKGEVFSAHIHPLPLTKSAALLHTGEENISWLQNRKGNEQLISQLSRYYTQIALTDTVLVGRTQEGSLEFIDLNKKNLRIEFFHMQNSDGWIITTPYWFDSWHVEKRLISYY